MLICCCIICVSSKVFSPKIKLNKPAIPKRLRKSVFPKLDHLTGDLRERERERAKRDREDLHHDKLET